MDHREYIWEVLRPHFGHNVEIVVYGSDHNVSLECVDCHEVLIDADNPDFEQSANAYDIVTCVGCGNKFAPETEGMWDGEWLCSEVCKPGEKTDTDQQLT